MNNPAKTTLIVSILFFLVASLYGCTSKDNAKSEKDILTDIENEFIFTQYSLEVDEYSIIKRQTSPDQKTDYVWIEVDASNDEFSYSAQYEILYSLYNEGWLLEYIIEEESSYSANNSSAVTVDWANQIMSEQGYEQYELSSIGESKNSVCIEYIATKSVHYLISKSFVKVYFSYEPSTKWHFSKIEEDVIERQLDVLGEWVFKNENRNYYLNIISINYNTMEFTYEYVLEGIVKNNKSITLSSNGTITKVPEYGKSTYSSDIFIFRLPTDGSMENCIEITVGGELEDIGIVSGIEVGYKCFFARK